MKAVGSVSVRLSAVQMLLETVLSSFAMQLLPEMIHSLPAMQMLLDTNHKGLPSAFSHYTSIATPALQQNLAVEQRYTVSHTM